MATDIYTSLDWACWWLALVVMVGNLLTIENDNCHGVTKEVEYV